jgi:hypothetical protein
MKEKVGSLKRINKIITERKREKTHINKIRDARGRN